jgi:hypothetical protein
MIAHNFSSQMSRHPRSLTLCLLGLGQDDACNLKMAVGTGLKSKRFKARAISLLQVHISLASS